MRMEEQYKGGGGQGVRKRNKEEKDLREGRKTRI